MNCIFILTSEIVRFRNVLPSSCLVLEVLLILIAVKKKSIFEQLWRLQYLVLQRPQIPFFFFRFLNIQLEIPISTFFYFWGLNLTRSWRWRKRYFSKKVRLISSRQRPPTVSTRRHLNWMNVKAVNGLRNYLVQNRKARLLCFLANAIWICFHIFVLEERVFRYLDNLSIALHSDVGVRRA